MASKLGSPITLLPPPPPTMPVHVPHQIFVRSTGSGHSAAAVQSVSRSSAPRPKARRPALPRISPPGFRAVAFSTSRNVERTNSVQGRMPLLSVRFALARKSARATSSMPFCFSAVASSRNFEISPACLARCGSRSAHANRRCIPFYPSLMPACSSLLLTVPMGMSRT